MPDVRYQFFTLPQCSMLEKFYKKMFDLDINEDDARNVMKFNNGRFYIAVLNGKIIAHAQIEKNYDMKLRRSTIVVKNLAVLEAYRRIGVGTRMLINIEDYAYKKRCRFVKVMVSKKYKSNFGFFKFNNYYLNNENIFIKKVNMKARLI